MQKTIITIAGLPGSGKSSTANVVAKELGYNRFSSGDLFREIATERGVSIGEINLIAEKQTEIDHLVDQRLRDIGGSGKNLVIDSRTAWHWIPESFKVFLTLDTAEAARRVFSQIQGEGRVSQTAENVEDVEHDIEARLASECKRYEQLYQINYLDKANYDLVIDTGVKNLQKVVSEILDSYQKYLDSTHEIA